MGQKYRGIRHGGHHISGPGRHCRNCGSAEQESPHARAIKTILGKELKWDDEDLYGYSRAFTRSPELTTQPKVVLDPTAGGGSIPFEAMRLGHHVIANELNPVAAVILYATLDYPARFGPQLVEDIERWGNCLVSHVEREMAAVTPFSLLPESER